MRVVTEIARRLSPCIAVLALGVPGCHLDSGLVIAITDEDHVEPPPVPDTTVRGRFESEDPFGVAGASVDFFLGDGSALPGLTAQVGPDGAFEVHFAGSQAFNNLLAYASNGAVALLGIVPEVPAVSSVYDPAQVIEVSQAAPAMDPIDDDATTIALLIEGRVRQQGSRLNDLSAGAVLDAMDELDAMLGDPPFLTVREMVATLLTEAAAQSGGAIPVFLPPNEIREAGSSLNLEFLATYEVDYDDDGTADTSTDAWEAAIAQAMARFTFDICFDPDLIRVVFQVDFHDGVLDGNCTERDREKWLDGLDPGDRMFLVGGVHEDMVRCDEDPEYIYCATQADIERTNDALNGWVPNTIRMFDDGTNGDATADDFIFTRVFDLPRGMQIGYKYTYGAAASLWTGTEEWPGNQRILELVDVNGDGMVVRRDNWGDEATNKDRANLRTPARGGRGTVLFDCGESVTCCSADESPSGVAGCVDANADGYLDYQEIPVDLDGDCEPDGFPPPGPNPPLTVECEE